MATRRKKDGAAPKPRRIQPASTTAAPAPVADAPAPTPVVSDDLASAAVAVARAANSVIASPARATLHEYRFTTPHRHAGRDYRPGDIVEITPAAAARIRAYAGADALVEWEG